MKFVDDFLTDRLPIKSWAWPLDDNAYEQAYELASHPFVVHHVALMPDCHMGYGMPIGGVIATKDVVIPNAVGSDIGCGMSVIKTNILISDIDMKLLDRIRTIVKSKIPIISYVHPQEFDALEEKFPEVLLDQKENAMKQLGTLGQGNHFIEFQAGDDGYLWIMIHSGSRNLGYYVNKKYSKIATDLCEYQNIKLPNKDIASLFVDSLYGHEYLKCMNFCLDYAYHNRNRMMQKIVYIIQNLSTKFTYNFYNIHHNYATLETHFNEQVWIHRKGATSAKKDQIGIIPGSMGTSSYIVKGLGNKESFESCSHGAGRVMGRNDASRNLSYDECIKSMDGILFDGFKKGRKTDFDLGEAPSAYKDIDYVMESQSDLVKIVHKLKPLAVIKG